MLNFLSQLFGKKRPVSQAATPENKKESSVSHDAKRNALEMAKQLPDDESAIVDFLLQCRFADARYLAAQKIRSVKAMEQARTAMQKTDRRVYRLMQTRLNEIAYIEKVFSEVTRLVGKASELVNETALTPNLVADLDREWKAVSPDDLEKLPAELKAQFEALRSQLESRLSSQLLLQWEVKSCYEELSGINHNRSLNPAERAGLLETFSARMEQWKQSPERFSLPRQLLSDFETKLNDLSSESEDYKREYDALQLRLGQLAEWEQSDSSKLDKSELEKRWAELHGVKDSGRQAELDRRFNALLAQLVASSPVVAVSVPKLDLPPSEALDCFSEHIKALQQAVEAGSVQDALTHDEVLRQLDIDELDIGEERMEQLSHLRNELRRLKGWAKWSGQLSREKLIRFALDLPEQGLKIEELADAVVRAREEWKSLNTISGMATREQWAEFDSACNRAYEPVLEHARQQAEEKEQNVLQAESIIARVRDFAEKFDMAHAGASARNGEFDWKPVINFYRQTSQSWRQIGVVGRKEKKRLDELFSDVMRPVREKLYEQTQLEIRQREQLIEEVEAIDPDHREAGKKLRDVQQKWQNCAKAFPLDNREDKKLWSRFREVCEKLHASRMEKNKAVDLERLQHLHQKEAICAELEAMSAANGTGDLENRIGELLNSWKSVGNVPKDAESHIQKRLDAAVAACRQRIGLLKSEKMAEALGTLCDKLRLCRSLENRIVDLYTEMENGSVDAVYEDEEYENAWKALPSLPEKMEAVLSNRFYNGLKAMAGRNRAYGKRLLNNVPSVREKLLRFEIIYGVASPQHLEEERRYKQMEVLQDAMGGSERLAAAEVVRQLLEMPALADEEDIGRINSLILKLNEPG